MRVRGGVKIRVRVGLPKQICFISNLSSFEVTITFGLVVTSGLWHWYFKVTCTSTRLSSATQERSISAHKPGYLFKLHGSKPN